MKLAFQIVSHLKLRNKLIYITKNLYIKYNRSNIFAYYS